MREVATEPPVPSAIEQMASEHGLGRPRMICQAGQEAGLFRVLGILSVLLGMGIIVAFVLLYETVFLYWPFTEAVLVPLVGCAWLGVGGWLLLEPLFSSSPAVYVCTKGLISARRRQRDIILWQQMERIWREYRGQRRGEPLYAYKIRRNDGELFPFGIELSDVERLGKLLEQEITARLLPRARSSYSVGATVSFDLLALNQQGLVLRKGQKRLSWDDFRMLSISHRTLSVHEQTGIWAILPLAHVPNVGVLSGLIEHAQGERARLRRPYILAYNAGESVDFGALRISRAGLLLDDTRLVLWQELASIAIDEREVLIKRKGAIKDWLIIPLWRLQHTEQLRDLLAYIMHI